MKYCVVVTVTAADTANQLRDLLGLQAGDAGLKDYVAGRDQDEATGEYQRWVLSFGGTGVTFTNPKGNPEEIQVVALFAFNSNVNQQIRDRIGQMCNARPMLARQLEFNPPLTRAEMVPRLTVEVGSELACDHYWHAKPTDDVTTGVTSAETLLAKFQPVPGG